MKKPALLMLLAVFAAGCSHPTPEQMQNDLSSFEPGCTLDSGIAGEGDSDNVWMDISYRCGAAEKQEVLLYQKKDGEWRFTPTGNQITAKK